MGREAKIRAQVGRDAGEVTALLESRELILRGALRRRWSLAALADLRVERDALVFSVAGESVRLALGAEAAAAWRRKIEAPPPSLAAKLGVGPATPAFVYGEVDDAALTDALRGATTDDRPAATQLVAVVADARNLAAALRLFARMPKARHAWLVYAKGKGAQPGDAAIRVAARAAGFRDTKTCAVSETLTATRYSRADGP